MQRETEPQPSRRQSSHGDENRTDTRNRAALVLRGMDAADYRPQTRGQAPASRAPVPGWSAPPDRRCSNRSKNPPFLLKAHLSLLLI